MASSCLVTASAMVSTVRSCLATDSEGTVTQSAQQQRQVIEVADWHG